MTQHSDGRGPVTRELIPLGSRRATVVSVTDLSPRIRRIVVHEASIAQTLSIIPMSPTDHVKVVLPDATGALNLPDVVDNRLVFGDDRPLARDYTVRAVDVDRSELTLDFVLHDHGPAAQWARAAKPTQQVGILGPRGTKRFPAGYGHYLLAVDETALPALCRFIEEVPALARISAFVSISDTDGRIELPWRDALWVTWLDESAGERLNSGHLDATCCADTFVWLAGEADSLKPLRRHLLHTMGVPRDRVQVEGYWRRGTVNYDHHEPIDGDDAGEAY